MNEWMHEWMNECVNEWINAWLNEWVNECVNDCVYFRHWVRRLAIEKETGRIYTGRQKMLSVEKIFKKQVILHAIRSECMHLLLQVNWFCHDLHLYIWPWTPFLAMLPHPHMINVASFIEIPLLSRGVRVTREVS